MHTEYTSIKRVAYTLIVAWPLGCTALYAALLWAARRTIRGLARPTSLSRAIAFLYEDYTPHAFW